MKKMKKLASLLLAMVMTMAMVAPAFAAGVGSITISNARVGETYKVYKIFELDENFDAENNHFSYKVTEPKWLAFCNTEEAKAYVEIVLIDGVNYVSWKQVNEDGEAVGGAEFAKLAITYAQANSIPAVSEEVATAAEGSEDKTTSLVFTGLGYGYFLIDSSMGALCALDTATPNATVTEKNEIPEVDKKVEEDSNQTMGSANDAQIGEYVKFQTTIKAKRGTENYVLHDTMEPGLSFVNEVVEGNDYTLKVTVGDELVTSSTSTYTLAAPATDGCTFDITFANAYISNLTKDLAVGESVDIVVTYYAQLNEKAEIAADTNDNTTHLTYGENSRTEDSKTETKTFKFDLVKTDVEGTPLDGATFQLFTSETGGTAIQFKLENGVYRVATPDEIAAGETTADIVATNGRATIVGLDGDSTPRYWLEETVVPTGYNALNARVEVKLMGDNIVAEDKFGHGNNGTAIEGADGKFIEADGDTGVIVVNKTGVQMPSTGGIGTTIFYVVGGLMVVGAGVLLVTKRRMDNK